eukprot:sb/3477043/
MVYPAILTAFQHEPTLSAFGCRICIADIDMVHPGRGPRGSSLGRGVMGLSALGRLKRPALERGEGSTLNRVPRKKKRVRGLVHRTKAERVSGLRGVGGPQLAGRCLFHWEP